MTKMDELGAPQCRVCRRTIPLTDEGEVYSHGDWNARKGKDPAYGQDPVLLECPGAEQKPIYPLARAARYGSKPQAVLDAIHRKLSDAGDRRDWDACDLLDKEHRGPMSLCPLCGGEFRLLSPDDLEAHLGPDGEYCSGSRGAPK